MKQCSICGKEFEKQGQLNFHQYHCKAKAAAKVPEKYEEKFSGCEHDYRLLNLHVAIENRAYEAGYMEVCRKCQSLQ